MELFEHQKTGIEFLKKTKKAILADEMGLGKTRMAIVAAGETSKGTLIVCPASLKINWKREIGKVYPDHDVEIITTTEDIEKVDSPWFIINYDILEKKREMIEQMIESKKIDTLILDEAHYIKGKSIRSACIIGGKKKKKDGKAFKADGIAGQMKQVYCLTGTPLLNRPIEMFNLLKAINHKLGEVRGFYAKRYCGAFPKSIFIRKYNRIMYFMDESGATNLDELRTLLKGSLLRRKKKDVLNLPLKIISIMESELTVEWQRSYDAAWEMYIDFLKKNPDLGKDLDNIIMAKHLVEIQKLKQVCSRSKVDRIVSDIQNAVEQEQKIIVFTQYTNTLKDLEEKLTKLKIGNVTLSGEDDMDERQESVDAFQNTDKVKVFIANIKAGGVGLTLTAASIVMFADMDWSPEIHRQAEDRAHRIGQEGMVNVYYYVATGTIEEDIVEILNSKKEVMDQVLEGKANSIKNKSMQEVFLKLMSKKAPVDNSR